MMRDCLNEIGFAMVCWLCILSGHSIAHETKILFDGTSLDAWRGYGADAVPNGWVIVDGELFRKEGGGDIMTKEQFENFELTFEWKISEGGNSGVMYLVSEGEPAAYFTGPEYQLLDNTRHADSADAKTSAGALYGLYKTDVDAVKPVGEWNEARIVVEDGHVQHWLNGKQVVACQIGSEDWDQRVSASKFNAWKKFGKNTSGHIVLQDHNDPVWYRNIRIVVGH